MLVRHVLTNVTGHGSRLDEPFSMDKAVDDVAALIQGSVPNSKALVMGVHLGGMFPLTQCVCVCLVCMCTVYAR